ncbi:calcium binding protein 39 [Salpingoeca rosetta]|uniref:Calcium binding protein 39 n=1 Tax=Salpingoeca rosetta (strain ATCC 50818 / BSB-021) TaxID=946362 RepID=F2UJ12_SALR5|nr:calcium binding protein 39 [Salpingoeca rosetta]EGD76960.1 calcium binding protein 39 [Salpingoeca rosetta]|eukprot:XP_004990800.1 calcium binding protein 39 [Salpingoeca rosetta]
MPKSPVQKLVGLLEKLDSGKKAQDEFLKCLLEIKKSLIGGPDSKVPEEVSKQLAKDINANHVLYLLVLHMPSMDFEAKKVAVQIFNKMELFYPFFQHVQKSEFDIASDAFASLKALLTSHKILCAEFLEKNYEKVFQHYQQLLESENYVTKRQSLKLLGELLLDRANFTVMTKYISDPVNLKLMMNLLRNPSKNIQFEAFHVFKVFVANPNKTQPIMDILLKNKDKLVKFLANFHNDRAEDEQFAEEKQYLVKQIKDLK